MCPDFSPGRQNVVKIFGVCTTIFACICLAMKICELINLGELVRNCRKDNRKRRQLGTGMCINCLKILGNNLNISVYILSFYFSFFVGNKCLCPSYGQWQVGIVVILLAWVNLLYILKKWPRLGKYIAMFQVVMVRFMRVLIIAVVLLVAYSLAFYMAFHESGLHVSYKGRMCSFPQYYCRFTFFLT